MSDRLSEIEKRDAEVGKHKPALWSSDDRRWMLANTKTALALIAAIKARNNPSWKEVPIGVLNVLEKILRGESDGSESGLMQTEVNDG